jgi:phosphonate transport system substrate-binding protein
VNLDGTSTYHGYLFVRKDSRIHDPPSMRGKRMAFVDRGTTAGYTFPMAWLRERGVASPRKLFREVWFTGSHDGAVHAVLEGRADVGAAKDAVYDRLRARDPRVDRDLLILASSPAVPSNGLCVRKGLDPRLREALRAALLGLEHDAEGAAALKGIGALRFVETTAADYAPALELARKAGVDPRRWSGGDE